ncbi:MAG: carboxypeptidase-like regulatory domain-containing protein, partial [Bryobacteraceae bacterium]
MKLRIAEMFSTAVLIVFGSLLAGPAAFGQTVTATLTGSVVDASGASVPDASVTLTNASSGNVRKTVTNASGYYAVPAIPAGTYTLTVEAKGFQKSEVKDFALNSADERKIDVTMTLGAVTETVSVTASAEQVETSSGEKAQVLDTQVLQNVAVVGRSAAEFLKILPGMTQTGNGVTNAPGYSGEVIGINGNGNAGKQSALGNFSANGTPTASMEIMSDGAHVSDPGCNCATPVNPNAEMIQEVKVLQAAFSAENSYGPVVINTTTKAGGSAFHGEAYLSARNYVLNANDSSSNAKGLNLAGAEAAPRPQNRYYFPGGNIGGPVLLPHFNKKRDKLFFFSGFEYFYQA